LRKDALPFSETLAQSVANIAPTATPAVNLGLVFAASGQATWFTYLVATVGLLLIGICIAQFAKRSATPGSLYAYVSRSLGPSAGFFTGWGLIWLTSLQELQLLRHGFVCQRSPLGSNISLSPFAIYAICAVTIS
jgi:amino acid transporter